MIVVEPVLKSVFTNSTGQIQNSTHLRPSYWSDWVHVEENGQYRISIGLRGYARRLINKHHYGDLYITLAAVLYNLTLGVDIHPSARTLKPLTIEENNMIHLNTVPCSRGNPRSWHLYTRIHTHGTSTSWWHWEWYLWCLAPGCGPFELCGLCGVASINWTCSGISDQIGIWRVWRPGQLLEPFLFAQVTLFLSK